MNDIVAVQEEIMDASAHYYDIGVKLGLKSDDLNGIKDEVPDHATAITMITSRWLKRQFNVQQYGEPTWKSLIEAVAHRNGGNNTALAMKLADKHKGNSMIVYGMQATHYL